MASTADLAEPLRSRVDALLRLAGGAVTVTSGRRTYAQQVALRRTNGCPDLYTSPSSSCRVATAIPGTSRHESGLAVDLGGNLALAAQLAPLVGLKRTVPSEAWHFEPIEAKGKGGDTGEAGAAWNVVNSVAAAGGDDSGVVDGIIRGARNLTVTGLILAGAAALVVMGGYRAVTGRALAGDVAKVGAQAGTAAATGGTSIAAKAAGSSKAHTASRRRSA